MNRSTPGDDSGSPTAACICGQRHTTWTNDKDVSNEGHSVACPANPQFAKPSAAKRQESAAYWIKTADHLARRVDELEAELFRLKAERRAAIDELERLRHSDRALLLVAERDAWREKAAIFASAIGLARLHLLNGEADKASAALDKAVTDASRAMAASYARAES